jgi:chromate transporter
MASSVDRSDATPGTGADAGDGAAPPPPSLSEALRFWFWLGWVSFGGPAGQIAILHAELVERRRWISERRFLHALNYCMLLPGPEAQQLATYLGWLLHRSWGGIVAGALFVLPSLLVLIVLSWIYMAWGHTVLVSGLFHGIKPAVVAIVLQAAWRIGSRTLRHPALALLAIAAFLSLSVGQVPFPAVIAAAALIGWLGGRWAPNAFAPGGGHAAAAAAATTAPTTAPTTTSTAVPPTAVPPTTSTTAPTSSATVTAEARQPRALIDDDTPTPAHARFSPRRLAVVLGCGLLLWLLPMLAAFAWHGGSGTLTQMGRFFTQAALLTFGGAYAVLPYVYQGAVTQFGWLSGPQMIDGLALGESTPGPLIMVVAFVGFVGGWQAQDLAALLGPGHAALAGILAAVLVTWVTFLPSFVFILAGGPLVEATHGRLGFTAPLTAITAAVVGVIANLALFFGWHALWPQGWDGGIDIGATAIAVVAALLLLRARWSALRVIALSALAGLVLTLLR